MKTHSAKRGHFIVISLVDHKFWCYKCETFVLSAVFSVIFDDFLKELLKLKEIFTGIHEEMPIVISKKSEISTKSTLKNEINELANEISKISITPKEQTPLEKCLSKIASGECKKIVILTGAGISVNAGIPDFRTPGTGLYSQLEKYKLPYPEAIFEMGYFEENPQPFYSLAKEMFSKKYVPTKTHYFIRLFQEKKILMRNYTQNIDGLEKYAGLKSELLIQAHGGTESAHCIKCNEEIPLSKMNKAISEATPLFCEKCKVPCKPDIVFFGERLPKSYMGNVEELRKDCDFLIIIGSSLVVYCFNMLPGMVKENVPRLIINNEMPEILKEDKRPNDVFLEGDCDEAIIKVVKILKWEKEFTNLMKEREIFAKKNNLKILK